MVVPYLVRRANEAESEGPVSGLWISTMASIGYTADNGWSLEPETRTNDDDTNAVDIGVIYIRDEDAEVLMIIECKTSTHDTLVGWDKSGTQLAEYVREEGCERGILAIGAKCKFYHIPDDAFAFIDKSREYDWDDANDAAIIEGELRHFLNHYSFTLVGPAAMDEEDDDDVQ